jgi:hypothetical protein
MGEPVLERSDPRLAYVLGRVKVRLTRTEIYHVDTLAAQRFCLLGDSDGGGRRKLLHALRKSDGDHVNQVSIFRKCSLPANS